MNQLHVEKFGKPVNPTNPDKTEGDNTSESSEDDQGYFGKQLTNSRNRRADEDDDVQA